MLTMPAVDQEAIGDRERIAADLARLVAPASVIAAPAALRAYESDGLTAYRQPPLGRGAAGATRRRSPPCCAIATSAS